MIPIDLLIRSSHTWYEHPYAVPGTDQVMSALVQLRILGSELLSLFWMDPSTFTAEVIAKNEVRLQWFNADLDRWESNWHKIVEEASENVSHRFMVSFYGKHLRLVLNSYRLQLSVLGGGGVSKQALSFCHTSALEMLRLVVDKLGTGTLLLYCQDSVHAMIAYSVVVIVKVRSISTCRFASIFFTHITFRFSSLSLASFQRNPKRRS